MNDLGASVIVTTHIDNAKPNDRSTAMKRQINRIDCREHIEFDVFTLMSDSILSDVAFRFPEPKITVRGSSAPYSQRIQLRNLTPIRESKPNSPKLLSTRTSSRLIAVMTGTFSFKAL